MRAGQHFGAGAWRASRAGAAHRDVLVRDQQRADRAPEVVDAALHEPREIVGGVAVRRFVLRRAEQQLEVAVAHDEAALQVADARLRRRARAAGTAVPGAATPARSENGRAFGVRARGRPGRPSRSARASRRAAGRRRRPARRAAARTKPSLPVRRPQLAANARPASARCRSGSSTPSLAHSADAHPIVDHDRLGPRQQHLDELPVRVERRCADGMRRITERQSRSALDETSRIDYSFRIGIFPASDARQTATRASLPREPDLRVDRNATAADLEVQGGLVVAARYRRPSRSRRRQRPSRRPCGTTLRCGRRGSCSRRRGRARA